MATGYATLSEGYCMIGQKAEIEDGEIHAIQEGLAALASMVPEMTRSGMIYLYVDNQNALRGPSGGPTSCREFVRKCLEEGEILRQRGCKIQGKWTPTNQISQET